MRDADLEAASRAHVIRDYVVQYTNPIRVRAGQPVRVGREDDEYPGWWWCTAPDGRSSWVPGELLRTSGAEAHMLEDYDATELAVHRGEEVLVSRGLRDWLWVTNAAGESGWIPAACVAA